MPWVPIMVMAALAGWLAGVAKKPVSRPRRGRPQLRLLQGGRGLQVERAQLANNEDGA